MTSSVSVSGLGWGEGFNPPLQGVGDGGGTGGGRPMDDRSVVGEKRDGLARVRRWAAAEAAELRGGGRWRVKGISNV